MKAFLMIQADRVEFGSAQAANGLASQTTRLYLGDELVCVILLMFPPGSDEARRLLEAGGAPFDAVGVAQGASTVVWLQADRIEHGKPTPMHGAVQQELRLYLEGRVGCVVLLTFSPDSDEARRFYSRQTADGMPVVRLNSIQSDAKEAA